jgi:adenosylcobinamide-GDP ribazoletransferase
MLRRTLSAFLIAVEFLTVVPVRGVREYGPRTVGPSLLWFPVVGLLIGGALVAVDAVASAWTTPAVTVALVLTANALLTGALHLDGLADAADGVFGGHTAARRLEIMKDSRIGTFGVLALVLVLLMQYAALASLSDSVRRTALLLAPMLSRSGMVLLIVAFPYARPSGLGRSLKDSAPRGAAVIDAATGAALAVVIGGLTGFGLTLIAAATVYAAGWYLARRLGGLTGDAYGAIAVLAETVLFLVISADPLSAY